MLILRVRVVLCVAFAFVLVASVAILRMLRLRVLRLRVLRLRVLRLRVLRLRVNRYPHYNYGNGGGGSSDVGMGRPMGRRRGGMGGWGATEHSKPEALSSRNPTVLPSRQHRYH